MQRLLLDFGVIHKDDMIWAAWYFWNHVPPELIEEVHLRNETARRRHIQGYEAIYGKPTKVKPISTK